MQEIKRGLAPAREATTLQVFLRECGCEVDTDGNFGPGTEAALKKFQADNGLIVDGVAGEKTWTTLFAKNPALLARMSALWLSQQDMQSFAGANQLDVPLVRTVYGVESGGCGFVGLRPKILFEGHVFWSELQKAGIDPASRQAGNEDILFPKWDPKSYKGGLAEYDRLERAKKIAAGPALRSASWGLFQILGLHAETLGYADVNQFVDRMSQREGDHLEAFGRFIQHNRFKGTPLIEHLRNHDWAAFAEGYNGSGFRRNEYDTKLAQAYQRYSALA